MKVKIYHNSRCSKSRQTLEILKKNNCDIEIIEYLKLPPTFQELEDILGKLKYQPRDLMRKGEEVYKKENLSDINLSNSSMKSKLRRANKHNAEYAIIIGDDELISNTAIIKPLSNELEEQITVSIKDLYSFYKKL